MQEEDGSTAEVEVDPETLHQQAIMKEVGDYVTLSMGHPVWVKSTDYNPSAAYEVTCEAPGTFSANQFFGTWNVSLQEYTKSSDRDIQLTIREDHSIEAIIKPVAAGVLEAVKLVVDAASPGSTISLLNLNESLRKSVIQNYQYDQFCYFKNIRFNIGSSLLTPKPQNTHAKLDNLMRELVDIYLMNSTKQKELQNEEMQLNIEMSAVVEKLLDVLHLANQDKPNMHDLLLARNKVDTALLLVVNRFPEDTRLQQFIVNLNNVFNHFIFSMAEHKDTSIVGRYHEYMNELYALKNAGVSTVEAHNKVREIIQNLYEIKTEISKHTDEKEFVKDVRVRLIDRMIDHFIVHELKDE